MAGLQVSLAENFAREELLLGIDPETLAVALIDMGRRVWPYEIKALSTSQAHCKTVGWNLDTLAKGSLLLTAPAILQPLDVAEACGLKLLRPPSQPGRFGVWVFQLCVCKAIFVRCCKVLVDLLLRRTHFKGCR